MGAGDTGRATAQRLVDAALAEVGLAHFSHRQLPTLSGGEQQRAHFARVLVQLACGEAQHGPGLLLLDEPTSSLDMRHQIDLVETARRRAQNGTAVVAVLHDLNLAMRFADRIVLLHRGKLAVDGGRTEAITAETIRRIFEVDVRSTIPRAACRSCCRRPCGPRPANGITPQPLSNGVTGSSQNCQPPVTSAPQDTAHRHLRRSAMRMSLLCSVASVFLASAAFAQGEGEFPATLKGHAVLPAQSFIDAPADAPDDLKTSGKYTTGKRVDAVGSVMGKSYERPTGVSLPFKGQPLQGHSGIKVMPDGSFWVLTDNGMGSRYNSAELDAVSEPAQDRLGGRQDRAAGNHLPARSRQESSVPHRPRGHCKALSDRRRFRHRGLSDHRRHLLDRRRVRPLCAEGRQDRQDPRRVRNHGRRQAGALAGSLVGAVARRPGRELHHGQPAPLQGL